MSWLSDLLGKDKMKLPVFKPAKALEEFGEYGIDSYLKSVSRKSGFTNTIIAGNKKPKLGALTLLG